MARPGDLVLVEWLDACAMPTDERDTFGMLRQTVGFVAFEDKRGIRLGSTLDLDGSVDGEYIDIPRSLYRRAKTLVEI